MATLDDWQPRGVDTRTPNVARMYDYYLGGKDNYAPDREAAEQALAAAPEIPALARANRAFLGRAVRFLATRGVRQFIDLGTGLPTRGSVYQIAHAANPQARVVYVDNDPVVLAHARALLEHPHRESVAVIDADLRHPHQVFDHPRVQALIDFDQPVAVLALLILHFLTDVDKPRAIIERFRDAMAPGSYLVLSHGTDERRRCATRDAARAYDNATATVTLRSRTQIGALFEGFTLVHPGLVYLHEWHPHPEETVGTGDTAWGVLAGVARRAD